MKMYEIIDKLQYEIENASNVPLTNKVMFDKDELLDMIDDLRGAVPDELKEARKIRDEETRIKQAAQREANNMLKEAREQKAHLIDTNNITKNAYEEADSIVRDAKMEAARLRARSVEYVSAMLSKAQDDLREIISRLDENKTELKNRRKSISNTNTNVD